MMGLEDGMKRTGVVMRKPMMKLTEGSAARRSKRALAVVIAVVAAASMAAVGLTAVPPAHAVTYEQVLTARRQAQESQKRVAALKSQLSGVSADLSKQILELDDLTNNQIPAAQTQVDQAQTAADQAQQAAQAASQRLSAAQADKAALEKKIAETGKDYDDARAALAQVARSGMHGSSTTTAMSVLMGSKNAQQLVDKMQSDKAISRAESEDADADANTLSESKNRAQRLAAIEKRIAQLKTQADADSAAANTAAANAKAKADALNQLRNQGDAQRAKLESEQAQLTTAASQEAAANVIIQSRVDSYNQQYAAQQAAAAKRAAQIALEQQGRLRAQRAAAAAAAKKKAARSSKYRTKSSSKKSSGKSSWSSKKTTTTKTSGSGVSAGYVGHPTGDSGNAYPFSQCTWWAYVRRHQLGLPVGSYFGNGAQWADSARRLGYQVNHTPSVGAIMVFARGQLGANAIYGHVAIVERVNSDGSVTTSECGASLHGRTFSRRIYNTGAFWYIHN